MNGRPDDDLSAWRIGEIGKTGGGVNRAGSLHRVPGLTSRGSPLILPGARCQGATLPRQGNTPTCSV
jgi:hypothetical protein